MFLHELNDTQGHWHLICVNIYFIHRYFIIFACLRLRCVVIFSVVAVFFVLLFIFAVVRFFWYIILVAPRLFLWQFFSVLFVGHFVGFLSIMFYMLLVIINLASSAQ